MDCFLRLFNKFAFVMVARQNPGFTLAARETWRVMASSGMDTVAGDSLVGGTVFLACMTGSGLVFLVSALWCRALFPDTEEWVVVGVVAMLLGLSVFYIFSSIVSSAVIAALVCVAKNGRGIEHVGVDMIAAIQTRLDEVQADRAGLQRTESADDYRL